MRRLMLLVLLLVLSFISHVSIAAAQTPIPCPTLAATWGSGTATLQTDGNYDISGCTLSTSITNTSAEVVKPAQRDPTHFSTARCNNGTPFELRVQLSLNQSPDWLIYLRGGGFCDDQAASCASRASSQGQLMTTSGETDRQINYIRDKNTTAEAYTGIFSNTTSNPFRDLNRVYLHYCSSDLWSGATTALRPSTAGNAYFSGAVNFQTALAILKQRYGFTDSLPRKVMVSGSSAGGVGAIINADRLAQAFPQLAANHRLYLVEDAGLIIDFDQEGYRPGDFNGPSHDLVNLNYNFWGSSTLPACESTMTNQSQSPGQCFLGKVQLPYLSNFHLFTQYSSVDWFGTGIHHLTNNAGSSSYIVYNQPVLDIYRTVSLTELADHPWVFSGSNPYHDILVSDTDFLTTNTMPQAPESFASQLYRFWQDDTTNKQLIFGNPILAITLTPAPSPTSSNPPTKLGDFNGDNQVDFLDYSQFLPQFNSLNGNYKLIGTGLVNLFDFNKLLSFFNH